MTAVVLVRHGRTAWNAAGRYQGHGDPPLDCAGQHQAELVAAALAEIRPGLVLASDLQRARQTASIVAQRCRVPLITTAALREVDLGGWTGLSVEEAARQFPDEHEAFVADPTNPSLRRGGGETLTEAGQRVAGLLLAAAAACRAERPTVVVSHGLALQAALGQLAAAGVVELDHAPSHLANGAWIEVDVDPHGTCSELTGKSQARRRS